VQEEIVLSAEWETIKLEINGPPVEYPLMVVKIWGNPSLSALLKLMGAIKQMARSTSKEYISLTDLTHLNAGFLLESVLSLSMSASLKVLIGVKNKAKLSFVLLGRDTNMETLKKKLLNLNTMKANQDYTYRYLFIENKDQIKALAEKILSKG